MRWPFGGVLLLLCTGTLLAQSLGDVARAQRNRENGPKAKRVMTNADFATFEEAQIIEPAKASRGAQPLRPIPSENRGAQAPPQQRRIDELNQGVQRLTTEIGDLEGQRTSLNRSAIYGDPGRVERNGEIKNIVTEVEAKRKQLSITRGDLADELERARKSSVVK